MARLGSRRVAGHHRRGSAGHRSGHLAATILHGGLGLFPGEPVEGAGEHDRHSLQQIACLHVIDRVLHPYPGGAQFLDKLLVVAVGKPIDDRGGDFGPDPVDAGDVVLGGGSEGGDGAEAACQHPGHGPPNVVDAKPGEQFPHLPILCCIDGGEQVPYGDLTPAFPPQQVVRLEGEDVGGVMDERLGEQQVDRLVAEAFDVHCSATGEVGEVFPQAAGAGVAAGALRLCLPLRLDDGIPAERAAFRHLPHPRPCRSLRQDRADNLGNHVACPAHDHGVALTDVLAMHLALVVEGCVGDRDPPDKHRLEHGVRGDRTRSPNVDADLAQQGRLLLGGQLVGDGPARALCRESEGLLVGERVHLDHHSIGLVVVSVPGLFGGAHVGLDSFDVGHRLVGRVHRQPEVPQPCHLLGMGAERSAALEVPKLVHPDRQLTLCGCGRVLLPHRTGCGVARIYVRALAELGLSLVQLVECGHRHVDLAANLHNRRRLTPQQQRHRADRAHVGGDVLADLTVAAGRRFDQAPILIGERDRQPVDLQLARVRIRFLAEEPDQTLLPCFEILQVLHVVEREHSLAVGHRGEQIGCGAPEPLRGRVRCHQLGMLGLDGLQLTEQRVELDVCDLRIIEDVVAVVVVAERLSQLSGAGGVVSHRCGRCRRSPRRRAPLRHRRKRPIARARVPVSSGGRRPASHQVCHHHPGSSPESASTGSAP